MNLSSCPCPRCLVSKSRVHLLGTKLDMAARSNQPRTDDEKTQEAILKARRLIYEKGKVKKSTSVLPLLEPKSLVPTQVFLFY